MSPEAEKLRDFLLEKIPGFQMGPILGEAIYCKGSLAEGSIGWRFARSFRPGRARFLSSGLFKFRHRNHRFILLVLALAMMRLFPKKIRIIFLWPALVPWVVGSAA